jgi:hypothetical protein
MEYVYHSIDLLIKFQRHQQLRQDYKEIERQNHQISGVNHGVKVWRKVLILHFQVTIEQLQILTVNRNITWPHHRTQHQD